MKRVFLFLFFSPILLFSCQPDADKVQTEFDGLKTEFVDSLWAIYPGWATWEGNFAYADVLSVPDTDSRAEEKAFSKKYLDKLAAIEYSALDQNAKTDYRMMRNRLQNIVWEIDTFKIHEWDPSGYNVGGSINRLLISDYAPLKERMNNIFSRLQKVPDYYSAAKANLNTPSMPHLTLAVSQNGGTLNNVLGGKILDSLKIAGYSEAETQAFEDALEKARLALKDYVAFLESYRKENQDNEEAFRDFRIGKELFSRKFEFDIVSEYSAEEMYQKALSHKEDIHKKMVEISKEIWGKHMGKHPCPKMIWKW